MTKQEKKVDTIVHTRINPLQEKMKELYNLRTPIQEQLMQEIMQMFIDLKIDVMDILI
jgi:hypothetical protein